MNIPQHVIERLNAGLQKTSEDACWPFGEGISRYPKLEVNGEQLQVRRIAYEVFKGPIPAGMVVQSTCTTPRCCNPRHLYTARPRETLRGINFEKRFWAKVEKTETCWNWTGSTANGYGIYVVGRKQLRAHRVAWYLATGEWPPKSYRIMMCHACNNPRCVRVDKNHVYLGTGVTNAADRKLAGTLACGERHGSRTKPDRIRKAELNGRAELSRADVATILKTWRTLEGRNGLVAALARHYRKNETTIKDIVERRLWKDISAQEVELAKALNSSKVEKLPVHGVHSCHTKISNRQIQEIRFLYQQAGGRYGTIARLEKRYPIKPTQLARIVSRESRPEVPDDFDELGPLEPLFPAAGALPPAAGALPPAAGALPPAAGALPPEAGALPPAAGGLPPEAAGALPPEAGAIPPGAGTMPPEGGAPAGGPPEGGAPPEPKEEKEPSDEETAKEAAMLLKFASLRLQG